MGQWIQDGVGGILAARHGRSLYLCVFMRSRIAESSERGARDPGGSVKWVEVYFHHL